MKNYVLHAAVSPYQFQLYMIQEDLHEGNHEEQHHQTEKRCCTAGNEKKKTPEANRVFRFRCGDELFSCVLTGGRIIFCRDGDLRQGRHEACRGLACWRGKVQKDAALRASGWSAWVQEALDCRAGA